MEISKGELLLYAWLFVGGMTTITIFTNRKHHPQALFYLFFVELWERFSYYGMRAMLLLYMVKSLFYSDTKSAGIYAAYVSLVYATPVLGGFLAEKVLGARLSILLGGILMAIGHLAMAVNDDYIFLLALGFLIVGNGFFKPNISTLIGKLYPEGSPERDSGFTIFYMGINSGAFLAPLTCAYVAKQFAGPNERGDHYGFAVAGIGMLIGLCVFLYAKSKGIYEDKGLPPKEPKLSIPVAGLLPKYWVIVGAVISAPVFAVLVKYSTVSSYILYLVCLAVILILVFISLNEEKEQREKLWVILVLFFFSTLFWTFFELAGSALTLYTDRNVDRNVPGLGLVDAGEFQSINPLFIILLAPLFSIMWSNFKNVTIPQKFTLAMFQIGLAFGILVWGKMYAVEGLVPVVFIVLLYLFNTTGEICLSPIGLSLVTKLSPPKLVAFIMGIWLLSSTMAGLLGGEITKLTSGKEGEAIPLPEVSLGIYTDVFLWITYACVIAGIILALLSRTLKKWMHGVQ